MEFDVLDGVLLLDCVLELLSIGAERFLASSGLRSVRGPTGRGGHRTALLLLLPGEIMKKSAKLAQFFSTLIEEKF
jgi:hypothetical protein